MELTGQTFNMAQQPNCFNTQVQLLALFYRLNAGLSFSVNSPLILTAEEGDPNITHSWNNLSHHSLV